MDTYEKKYKDANNKVAARFGTNVAKEIFTDLYESEDERMMHQLHSWMKEFGGAEEYTEKVYQWIKGLLEKQGEQKPFDYENANIQQKDFAPMDEPMFKVGNWVVNKLGNIWHIDSFDNKNYKVTDINGNHNYFPISIQDRMHLWTIQDAKDGDVLASELCGTIMLYKGIRDNNIQFYCDYDFSDIDVSGDRFAINNGQHYGSVDDSDDWHPATKEQRDLLFKKMKEARFEWDSEKKELKKISQRMISAEAKEAMYDKPTDNDMIEALRTEYEKGRADAITEMEKPTWSVEDMSKVQIICKYLNEAKKYYADITEVRECIDWLKSLKDRVIPQSKQEWSEDDEAHINGIIDYLLDYKLFVYEEDMNVANGVQKELDWLKSLQRIGG